eukprot:3121397-Alexandrium_andersonii.AAC.1
MPETRRINILSVVAKPASSTLRIRRVEKHPPDFRRERTRLWAPTVPNPPRHPRECGEILRSSSPVGRVDRRKFRRRLRSST